MGHKIFVFRCSYKYRIGNAVIIFIAESRSKWNTDKNHHYFIVNAQLYHNIKCVYDTEFKVNFGHTHIRQQSNSNYTNIYKR